MYEKIPIELKELSQWVGWKYIDKPNQEKPAKVPFCPLNGKPASSSDAATWGTFEQALLAVEVDQLTGIGFMFANGIFGIDLDHCFDEDGVPRDFAQEILDNVHSYTELSPSGTGLHILCRGSLPAGGRKKGDIEMYSEGRYFTVTGNQYGSEYPLMDCTESVKPMHEKYLGGEPKLKSVTRVRAPVQHGQGDMSPKAIIERACAAKNGSKFRDMYDGRWQQHVTGPDQSQSVADMAFCGLLAFWCQCDEGLMDEIFRTSGMMRPKWDKRRGSSTYGQRTINGAMAACSETWEPRGRHPERPPMPTEPPPLPSRAVPPPPPPPDEPTANDNQEDTWLSEEKERVSQIHDKPQFYQYDDTGNAARLRDENIGFIKYNYTDKKWVIWDGCRWKTDYTEEIKRRADIMLQNMKKELRAVADEYANSFKKHISKSRGKKAKDAFIAEAQHLDGIHQETYAWDKFDKVSTLFNIANGTIALKTGLIEAHKPSRMISKISNIVYQPMAGCPRWEKFIAEITCDDDSLKLYLQRMVGYCMTALTKEQVMFFLVGNGSNGKSTFIETISLVMGEYASSCMSSTIMYNRDRNDVVRPDLADLKGRRMVTVSESREGAPLDESVVKLMTSGIEEITVRKLYGEIFSFKPEFKIVMSTNHKPRITGTDNGIWRRIRIIPFDASFTDEQKDTDLPERLKNELPGILLWALEGAVGYLAESDDGGGLPPCPRIAEAGREYRSEMDRVQQFLDDCTYRDPDSSVQSGLLYKVYQAWCADLGDKHTINNNKFSGEIKKKDYKHRKTSAYNEFLGIAFTDRGNAFVTLVARS